MVDQFLGGLFGASDQDDEPARRRRAQDFVDRYQRGAFDQMSDAEVLQNYRAAASRLTPDEYRHVTAEALRQMPKEQRRELKRYMRQHGSGKVNLPDDDDDSPEVIARAAQQAEQEHQGSGGLLGFLGLGGSKTPGETATQQRKEGGIDALISNPLAKIAVAAIAAMAARKLTEPHQ